MNKIMKWLQKSKKRLTKPIFLTAAATTAYKILAARGVITMDFGTYKDVVDIVTWGVVGIGVYAGYEEK